MSYSNSKEAPVESIDRKILDGKMLNATLSPDMNSGEADPSSPSVGMLRSCDLINSCASRGTHELPSETKDHSVKEKLLEAKKGESEVSGAP